MSQFPPLSLRVAFLEKHRVGVCPTVFNGKLAYSTRRRDTYDSEYSLLDVACALLPVCRHLYVVTCTSPLVCRHRYVEARMQAPVRRHLYVITCTSPLARRRSYAGTDMRTPKLCTYAYRRNVNSHPGMHAGGLSFPKLRCYPDQMVASACSKSARISLISSQPTESRIVPGVIPTAARSSSLSCEWVVVAGCTTNERMSPILARLEKSCSAFTDRKSVV